MLWCWQSCNARICDMRTHGLGNNYISDKEKFSNNFYFLWCTLNSIVYLMYLITYYLPSVPINAMLTLQLSQHISTDILRIYQWTMLWQYKPGNSQLNVLKWYILRINRLFTNYSNKLNTMHCQAANRNRTTQISNRFIIQWLIKLFISHDIVPSKQTMLGQTNCCVARAARKQVSKKHSSATNCCGITQRPVEMRKGVLTSWQTRTKGAPIKVKHMIVSSRSVSIIIRVTLYEWARNIAEKDSMKYNEYRIDGSRQHRYL